MTTTIQNTPPTLWRLLMKQVNPFMKWLLKSPLHGLVSRSYLLLTFTGRKSGTIYSTPVQYAQNGDTLYVISSAGYTWWKNLRGGADVRVHLRGKDCPAHADSSTDAQIIRDLLVKIYPSLSDERRERFALGKVAITIRLQERAVKS